MTVHVVVSVMDTAVGAFGRPVFVASTAVAIRSFSDEVNRVDANNEMNKHPDDFYLYEIGSFDDSSGILKPVEPARVLMRAKDCRISS